MEMMMRGIPLLRKEKMTRNRARVRNLGDGGDEKGREDEEEEDAE